MNKLPDDLIELMKDAYEISLSEDWNECHAQEVILGIAKIFKEIFVD